MATHGQAKRLMSEESNSMVSFDCVLGTLPLKTSVTVAVIGPNFNATSTMQGNYQVSMKMMSNEAEDAISITVAIAYNCRTKNIMSHIIVSAV